MQTEEFRRWLEHKGYDARTINSRIGTCETVCRCEGDIDDHYDEDECRDLLRRFTYTTEDEHNGRPTRHSIPINGKKRTGTSTLKSALNLYIKFLSGDAHEMRAAGQRAARQNRLWPDWNMPAAEECYQLAQATTKYLRFLAPEIVEAVVKDNERNRNLFCDYLNEAGIDPELYLWEKSSCMRRFRRRQYISAVSKRNDPSCKNRGFSELHEWRKESSAGLSGRENDRSHKRIHARRSGQGDRCKIPCQVGRTRQDPGHAQLVDERQQASFPHFPVQNRKRLEGIFAEIQGPGRG